MRLRAIVTDTTPIFSAPVQSSASMRHPVTPVAKSITSNNFNNNYWKKPATESAFLLRAHTPWSQIDYYRAWNSMMCRLRCPLPTVALPSRKQFFPNPIQLADEEAASIFTSSVTAGNSALSSPCSTVSSTRSCSPDELLVAECLISF